MFVPIPCSLIPGYYAINCAIKNTHRANWQSFFPALYKFHSLPRVDCFKKMGLNLGIKNKKIDKKCDKYSRNTQAKQKEELKFSKQLHIL